MFRRAWFIPIVVLAVIAIVAVIAMATSPSISDADMREARAVVKRYLDAYQRHDGQAICANLTPKVREQIGRSDDPRACAQELSRLSRSCLRFGPEPRSFGRATQDATTGSR
jgi:type II secretory pathway pseudopilin PulG